MGVLQPPRPQLHSRLPQARKVPHELQLGALALEQVKLRPPFLRLRQGIPAGGRDDLLHPARRLREDLVHARQHHLCRLGERQVQRVDLVAAEPGFAVLELLLLTLSVSAGAGAGGDDGLAHAHRHEGGKHVARAGEVGVDGGEDNLEEARLAGGGRHAGADDGEVGGRVIRRGEGDGGDYDVGDAVLCVQGANGGLERLHVGDFDAREEP